MKFFFYVFFSTLFVLKSNAQTTYISATELKSYAIKGKLTPLKTNYDVNYYHLDFNLNLEKQLIAGSSQFNFTAVEDLNKIQFDLSKNLKIVRIQFENNSLAYTREGDAVFISFPKVIKKGSKEKFTVIYEGAPKIARNPPWDGGIIFSKDNEGNHFASISTEDLGGSIWWPTKDLQNDKADSTLVSITIPANLKAISNGILKSTELLSGGLKKYNWLVNESINSNNTTFYIGNYANWSDSYSGLQGKLNLDFWSLKEDSITAKKHWDYEVPRMLTALEFWLGPFPWYKDGYKIVQSPFVGAEYQSANAYGNQFKKGYLGIDLSGTGIGLDWDYILVQNGANEWFGNSITAKDVADNWIKDGFSTYAEVLFTEFTQGKEAGNTYLYGLRPTIKNIEPIIGRYDANQVGSKDRHAKGANIIHMIRELMADDEKFRQLLHGLNHTHKHTSVTSKEIENYIANKSGLDLTKFFNQYLRNAKLPVFEYEFINQVLNYRWVTDVKDFNLPIAFTFNGKDYQHLKPRNEWQSISIDANTDVNQFKLNPNYYVIPKKVVKK